MRNTISHVEIFFKKHERCIGINMWKGYIHSKKKIKKHSYLFYEHIFFITL